MSKIVQAAQFAAEAHRGQTRKYTQRPYIEHPMRVAGRVMTLPHVDEDVVCAAWMHDVLEDCPGFGIPAIFSPRCHRMVIALTNLSKRFPEMNRGERKAMDRDHLRNCEHWVKTIKLVDRIDNIRDIGQAPSDFRITYLEESDLLNEALRVPGNDLLQQLHDELQQTIDEAAWI